MSNTACVIRVALVAGIDFETAFWAMQNIANVIGCQVEADYNDVIMQTYPRQPFTEFVAQFQQKVKK